MDVLEHRQWGPAIANLARPHGNEGGFKIPATL
jgi:hypothetical protein